MALRFEPPGPGSWELDPVHFPRPVTRYWTEIHPEALRRGVHDFTRFYGMLIDTLRVSICHEEIRNTITGLGTKPGNGLLVPSDSFTYERSAMIAALAIGNQVPAIY